jgi:hypothetical protein
VSSQGNVGLKAVVVTQSADTVAVAVAVTATATIRNASPEFTLIYTQQQHQERTKQV